MSETWKKPKGEKMKNIVSRRPNAGASSAVTAKNGRTRHPRPLQPCKTTGDASSPKIEFRLTLFYKAEESYKMCISWMYQNTSSL